MKPKPSIFRASVSLAGMALALYLASWAAAQAAPAPSLAPAWTSPSTMTLQKVGNVPTDGVGHSTYVDNLDCQTVSRPLAGSGTLQSGCFMGTAFGELDVENDLISFNDSDNQVVPLVPYSTHQFIWPWPGTVDALALEPVITGGSFVSLYTNILGNISDRLDLLGNVIAKQVSAPPNRALTDSTGNRLVVNPSSLTFSDGGSWLVVETMTGSFVRINLATLDVVAFAPSFFRDGGGAGLNESQLAISGDGRYVAIANVAANSLRVYDTSTCHAQVDQQFMVCASYNYWPFISGQVSAVDSLRHLRFLNNGLLSLIAVSGNTKTSYELAPTAGISALTDYLALGDSYTSGEGAYSYLEGTDTANNSCHLSANSYPLLLTHSLFTATGGHSVACSGAASTDVVASNSATYQGQAVDSIARSQRSNDSVDQLLNDFKPGYLPQSDFVSHYQPRIVTASIGGNDIGFGDILQECAAPSLNFHLSAANNCFATYEDRLELAQRIDREVPKLTTVFKKLRSSSPNSNLYIIGYPQIAVDNGNCALNVHLNTSEIELSIELIGHLNAAIAQAAQAAGGNYVDISQALVGHRLCETVSSMVAVNGATAGHDGGVTVTTVLGSKLTIDFLGKESYHPNLLGHELIEQAILQQTHKFTLAPSTSPIVAYPPAADDSQGLLKAPKSGRATKLTSSDNTIATSRPVAKGSQLQVKATSAKHSLKPNSSFQVTIGPGSQSAGNLVTNSSGDLVGSVTVPANAPSGVQIMTISGDNQLNQPIAITTVIYLIDSPDDYDGDGVPNDVDSCPTVVNSGTDADHDGIDDACDGAIGTAGDSSPPSGTTGGTIPASGASAPPTGSAASNAPIITPTLGVEPIGPVSVAITANTPSNDSPSVLPSTSPAPQYAGDGSLLDASDLTINGSLVTTGAIWSARQGTGRMAAGSSASKAVLGLQTVNPNSLRRTAKLQASGQPSSSQGRRLGGLWVIDWLPWVRLFVISLLLLLLASAVLGRQLRQQQVLNNY